MNLKCFTTCVLNVYKKRYYGYKPLFIIYIYKEQDKYNFNSGNNVKEFRFVYVNCLLALLFNYDSEIVELLGVISVGKLRYLV